MSKRRVLVADDDSLIREHLKVILEMDGLEVDGAENGRKALDMIKSKSYHLLICDWRMPDLDGMQLLTAVRRESMGFGVLVLTGYGDSTLAVEAMRAGADDFVTKPYEPDRLRCLVTRILEGRELRDEHRRLSRELAADYSFANMVSKSPKMRKVFDLIEQLGPVRSTVLIRGETGTGKELVAMAIHASDPRGGPFVAINCAALAESLLETELFGHERGAFTGAERRKKGRFELADGGTLFLDEIGEISPAMQAKLLRVLQSGRFERVGGTETLQVDVRIVAASHRTLEDEVKAGRLRADLFYRLSVVRVDLPPLRERPEDIPLLSMHFLDKLRARSTPPVTEIHTEAMQALVQHGWPGNVRELENAIRAAVALSTGEIIHRDALPAGIAPRRAARSAADSPIDVDRPLPELTVELIGQVEREYFARLLARYRGNVARCARHSGLSRRSVAQKLLKYGLDRAEFRVPAGGESG